MMDSREVSEVGDRMSRKPCSIEGCGRPVKARGWCAAHYRRWSQYGSPVEGVAVRQRTPTASQCMIDGCDDRHEARGLCPKHYQRAQRNGDVVDPPTRAERLWARVDKNPDGSGCWIWTGALTTNGYGQVRWGDRTLRAYRLVYELLVGPIPDGLQLDHLCRNRRCVNPAHLEPVTQWENWARGMAPSARAWRQKKIGSA